MNFDFFLFELLPPFLIVDFCLLSVPPTYPPPTPIPSLHLATPIYPPPNYRSTTNLPNLSTHPPTLPPPPPPPSPFPNLPPPPPPTPQTTPSLHLTTPTYPPPPNYPPPQPIYPPTPPSSPAPKKLSAFLKHFNVVCWANFVFFISFSLEIIMNDDSSRFRYSTGYVFYANFLLDNFALFF